MIEAVKGEQGCVEPVYYPRHINPAHEIYYFMGDGGVVEIEGQTGGNRHGKGNPDQEMIDYNID
jgi:hypothetical protein